MQGCSNLNFKKPCTRYKTLFSFFRVNGQRENGRPCCLQIIPYLFVEVWSTTLCKAGMKRTLRVSCTVLQGRCFQDEPYIWPVTPPPSPSGTCHVLCLRPTHTLPLENTTTEKKSEQNPASPQLPPECCSHSLDTYPCACPVIYAP